MNVCPFKTSSLLENLSMILYECIRPLVLDVTQIELLCDIVRMIKMEIIAGDLIKRSTSLPLLLIQIPSLP